MLVFQKCVKSSEEARRWEKVVLFPGRRTKARLVPPLSSGFKRSGSFFPDVEAWSDLSEALSKPGAQVSSLVDRLCCTFEAREHEKNLLWSHKPLRCSQPPLNSGHRRWRTGGLGSAFTLSDVENPPLPAFLHVRRLCHRDSDFPVFLHRV